MNTDNNKICPVAYAPGLDNSIRKFLQNPYKILKPFIRKGMTVLDIGCGPGFFSVEIAKMLDGSGKVIAADLQKGMLDIISQKVTGTELENHIVLHQCKEDSIDLQNKVDFIFAFYMIHEVPDQDNLLREMKSLLNPGGQILIIEPKIHVTKKAFNALIEKIENIGLDVISRPTVFFSRAVVLKNKEK